MAKIRPAATLLLLRPSQTPAGCEVACVHRARGLRFLGDFWAFPGGRADKGELSSHAALRETFEEIGVLLGAGAGDADPAKLADCRQRLLDDALSYPAALAELGVADASSELVPCGRWLTPPFGPVRFDTNFFLGLAPPTAELHVIEGELDQARWRDPAEVLEAWANDEALLAPPTRVTLENLVEAAEGEGGDCSDPAWRTAVGLGLTQGSPQGGDYLGGIDFRPGIRLFPVRTPTLPPATHTNCYIVGAGAECVVIDPASPYEDEQARLHAYLDHLAAGGTKVREVILTHQHPDHVGGASELARQLGVPIAAHPTTKALLQGKVEVTRELQDGEVIDLPGGAGTGQPDRRLVATLTEGHSDGHLAFQETTTGGVIAADMVAGVGTIMIDPPEGKMTVYLESLQRLKDLDPPILYPSHGPPIGNPPEFLDHYLAHRLKREGKVLAAVERAGPGEVEVFLPHAYDDTPEQLYPLAARSLLAHLEKLEQDGKVTRSGDTWSLRS